MIRHIVLIRFRPDIEDSEIDSIFEALPKLQQRIPGFSSFTAGKSESSEQIERGYMHGFIADFTDWDALQTYQDDPEHKAFGAKLVANAVGGIDGILVFDMSFGV